MLVPLASGVRRRSASQGSTASRAGTCATFAAHAAMPLRRVEAGSEAPLSTRANCTIRAKRSIRRATLATVVVPRCRVSAPAMVLARGEARGGRDDNEQHRRGRRSLPRVVRRRGLASSHEARTYVKTELTAGRDKITPILRFATWLSLRYHVHQPHPLFINPHRAVT